MVQRLLHTILNKKNSASLNFVVSVVFSFRKNDTLKKMWDTFFSFLLTKCFCVCTLLLKSLLWICNCLLTFSLRKTNFYKTNFLIFLFFFKKKNLMFISYETLFSHPVLPLFFVIFHGIVVCSVVGVTRTSAAGHPLHQAVSCHFLSFLFIVSVFSLPRKKSCLLILFDLLLLFSLSMNSSLFQLLFLHLFFERLFQNLPLLFCAFFSVLFFSLIFFVSLSSQLFSLFLFLVRLFVVLTKKTFFCHSFCFSSFCSLFQKNLHFSLVLFFF